MIRRAVEADAVQIHEAHMRSIREVCSKDHSPEEIAAWGGRTFNPTIWPNAIKNQSVWVVEFDGAIEGLANIHIFEKDSKKMAYIHALYLTPLVLGKGYGAKLAQLMLSEARAASVEIIELHSTITAHAFYSKLGFHDAGSQKTVEIGGYPIRCFPMRMKMS